MTVEPEPAITEQDVPKAVATPDHRTGGNVASDPGKHKGGYSKDSHTKHPGVSVVKRGKVFFLKWRIDFQKGVYRYQWERLDSKNKLAAEKEAKHKSAELKAKHLTSGSRRPSTLHRLPIAHGLDAYVAHVESERRERGDAFIARAKSGAVQYLDRFIAFINSRNIPRCERLTIDDLQDFRTELGEAKARVFDKASNDFKDGDAKLTNVSVNRILDGVRSALRFMVKRRYLTLDKDEIGEALEHYEVRRDAEPRILTKAELKRLITKLREHDSKRWKSSRKDKNAYHQKRSSETAAPRYRPLAPFIVTALLTGARPGEIENITADDVRLEYQSIALRDTKRGRVRPVPMHDSPLLCELMNALLLRAGGKPLIGRVKLKHVVELGKQAGIDDLNRQTLRRTCVAHVASGSIDSEYLLSSRFGHSTDVSISHYRQALHGVRQRGDTVEAWLGVEDELRGLLADLGYINKAEPIAKMKKVGT